MSDFNITPIKMPILPEQSASTAGKSGAAERPSFSKWLNQSLSEVSQMQQNADQAAQKLITGENKDIHGTMITMQKASIAFDLTMEVRNKIISAYDEIKRMQF